MYGLHISDETYKRFADILDYMNKLEREYKQLYNLDDEKSVEDREWVWAKITGAKYMFDMLNNRPELHLVLDDEDNFTWKFQIDLSAFKHVILPNRVEEDS